MANVEGRADLEVLAAEMEDRFGPLPQLVLTFLEVMDLRRVLREYMVTSIYKKGEKVTLHFHPDSQIKGERLVALLQKDRGRSQLTPDLRFTFTLKPDEDVMVAARALLQSLGESC